MKKVEMCYLGLDVPPAEGPLWLARPHHSSSFLGTAETFGLKNFHLHEQFLLHIRKSSLFICSKEFMKKSCFALRMKMGQLLICLIIS